MYPLENIYMFILFLFRSSLLKMADTPFDVQGDDILICKTINYNYSVDKMHLPRHYIASNGGKLPVNGGIREGGGGGEGAAYI